MGPLEGSGEPRRRFLDLAKGLSSRSWHSLVYSMFANASTCSGFAASRGHYAWFTGLKSTVASVHRGELRVELGYVTRRTSILIASDRFGAAQV